MIVTNKVALRIALLVLLLTLLQTAFFSQIELLGTSCLIFMGVGYLAGIYRERGDDATRGLTAVFCGLATLASNLAMGLFALVLGLDAPLSPALLADVGIQTIYGFLMAFPLYWLIRRVLRPAIIDDRTARRRRRPKAIGV